MSEQDPLRALLHEWQDPEPPTDLDRRVMAAYRNAVGPRPPFWARLWQVRISVPAPALALAVLAAIALFLLVRRPSEPPPSPPVPNLVSRLDGTGFQPLPNGEARVISVTDLKRKK
jgi:hypothetical protein